MLRANWISGLVILAVAPVIWQLGRVTQGRTPASRLPAVGAARLFAIAVSIVAVALISLIIAVWGNSVPGALR